MKYFVTGQMDASAATMSGITYVIAAGINGLVWGYLYLKTNNLWAPCGSAPHPTQELSAMNSESPSQAAASRPAGAAYALHHQDVGDHLPGELVRADRQLGLGARF